MDNSNDKENFKVELCRTDAGNIIPCVRLEAGTENIKMRDGDILWYPSWEEVEFLWDCMQMYEKSNPTSNRPTFESDHKRPTSMTQQPWNKQQPSTVTSPPTQRPTPPINTAKNTPFSSYKPTTPTTPTTPNRPTSSTATFNQHADQQKDNQHLVDHVIAKQKKENEEQTAQH